VTPLSPSYHPYAFEVMRAPRSSSLRPLAMIPCYLCITLTWGPSRAPKVVTVNGVTRTFTVQVWNATVANLTLMALGSSAPEILLSVIEITTGGFFAGELGPSTIVGSAAFNLLVISAVCIVAIPAGESRLIKDTGVFYITAAFSILAYIWLVVILQINTPNFVDVWEGVATFLAFPFLVWLAYLADSGAFSFKARHLVITPMPLCYLVITPMTLAPSPPPRPAKFTMTLLTLALPYFLRLTVAARFSAAAAGAPPVPRSRPAQLSSPCPLPTRRLARTSARRCVT
jgi:hypothetical protein